MNWYKFLTIFIGLLGFVGCSYDGASSLNDAPRSVDKVDVNQENDRAFQKLRNTVFEKRDQLILNRLRLQRNLDPDKRVTSEEWINNEARIQELSAVVGSFEGFDIHHKNYLANTFGQKEQIRKLMTELQPKLAEAALKAPVVNEDFIVFEKMRSAISHELMALSDSYRKRIIEVVRADLDYTIKQIVWVQQNRGLFAGDASADKAYTSLVVQSNELVAFLNELTTKGTAYHNLGNLPFGTGSNWRLVHYAPYAKAETELFKFYAYKGFIYLSKNRSTDRVEVVQSHWGTNYDHSNKVVQGSFQYQTGRMLMTGKFRYGDSVEVSKANYASEAKGIFEKHAAEFHQPFADLKVLQDTYRNLEESLKLANEKNEATLDQLSQMKREIVTTFSQLEDINGLIAAINAMSQKLVD